MYKYFILIIILIGILIGIYFYNRHIDSFGNIAGYDPATRSYYNYFYAEQLARDMQE